MISLSLNLSNLSLPAFIEKCRSIVTAMTGNANFPTPNPALTDITKAINELEISYQLGLSGNHSQKLMQKMQRISVNQMMQQLKNYVQNTAGDDLDVGLTSGIEARKKNERHSTIDIPKNVRATPNGSPGTGHILWNGVKNRSNYQVYQTTDMNDLDNRAK